MDFRRPDRLLLVARKGGFMPSVDHEPGQGRWICLVHADWKRGALRWTPLCRHRSTWRTQDDHPHPVFGPDGRWIWFIGSAPDGRRAVFRVAIPDLAER